MEVFELEIPGKPQPMQEIEFNYKTKAVYRSTKYKKHKENITFLCQEFLDQQGLPSPLFVAGVPLLLSLVFTFEFSTDLYISGNKDNYLKDDPPHWYTKKVDLDNMLKPLKDGMSGVVYDDDSQVCRYGIIDKVYGYVPSTLIKVTTLPYYL